MYWIHHAVADGRFSPRRAAQRGLPRTPGRMMEGISGQVIKLSTTTIGSEANLGWGGMVGMAFAKKGGFKFAAWMDGMERFSFLFLCSNRQTIISCQTHLHKPARRCDSERAQRNIHTHTEANAPKYVSFTEENSINWHGAGRLKEKESEKVGNRGKSVPDFPSFCFMTRMASAKKCGRRDDLLLIILFSSLNGPFV